MLKKASFADIRITGVKPVFFSCPCHNIKCTVIIDLGDFPKLVHHIMILFSMLERIYLLCPGTWTKRAFRLMVNNHIASPELYHLDLLFG
jgi:hypothetical protein